mgnify:CR=1 FL=1
MYHHVFHRKTEVTKDRSIIEKKAIIIMKESDNTQSHRCHIVAMASRFLVPPSPQDRAPAPIHALHSPYHLACIRLVPYDYPTHATTTTKYRAQAEQESSICRSPATPGHCQDHVHTRHEVQSRAHSAHLVDRGPQEDARDDQAARDLQMGTVHTPGSTTAASETPRKNKHRRRLLTITHERRGQAR